MSRSLPQANLIGGSMEKPVKNLEGRRSDFADCSTMAKALGIVSAKEIGHNYYSFYTFLDRIKQMLTGKTPCMWLTRIDSEMFDDLIECRKFGSKAPKKQSKTFIKCFSYGFRESAAMWGLYCPPTYKAIRVTVSAAAMESLRDKQCFKITSKKNIGTKISTRKEFTDITYAAVKMNDDEVDRSNKLYWDGVFTQTMQKLEKDRRCAKAAGRIKDIEWSFENEARLIATTRAEMSANHIVVELSEKFIKSMRFTLSPWANDDEQSLVRGKIVAWLKVAGRSGVSSEDEDVFMKSTLKGALTKWAERRGLD